MKYFITGGAGFIGSNMAARLLKEPGNEITVFDNFSSGKMEYVEPFMKNDSFTLVRGDLLDLDAVKEAIAGHDFVFHFAANADIALSMTQTDLDLKMTVLATFNLVEAMRVNGVKKIAYSSGSGVYGDVGYTETAEDFGPLLPISMYGASKLGAEGIIAAFSHMFDMRAYLYRFANVVGKKQTHGVGFDFIRKLRNDPSRLKILGDGTQSKSYIYVDDVLDGMWFVINNSKAKVSLYNIATDDYITVNEIAEIVIEEMGLKNVALEHTGGDRGWKGDVPIVRFDLTKIHTLGWKSGFNSSGAFRQSVKDMLSGS